MMGTINITHYITKIKNYITTKQKVLNAGIFFVLPCIETYQKVDLRTITLGVPPQEVDVSNDSDGFDVDYDDGNDDHGHDDDGHDEGYGDYDGSDNEDDD